MTNLNKLQERVAFVEAEIARVAPDRRAYQRFMRGKAPHPGQEVAGNAGYYNRRVSERSNLRRGIKAAEAEAARAVRFDVNMPSQQEIEDELADMRARLEDNESTDTRRRRSLTEFIALAMGQMSALDKGDHDHRAKLSQFIDFCFQQVETIKNRETSHEDQTTQAA